jgi:hypothetical protein
VNLESAFDRFQEVLVNEAGLLLEANREQILPVLEYSLGLALNHTGDLDEPDDVDFSPEHTAVRQLYLEFEEIAASLDSLRNIEIYVRRSPYSDLGIDRVVYLRYHVENYLQELYVLKCRIDAFLTRIARLYKLHADGQKIKRAGTAIRRHLDETLSGLVKTRGSHVHRRRYDDSEISNVSLFNLLGKDNPLMGRLGEVEYRRVRGEKRRWMSRTNESLRIALDAYFAILYADLVDGDGRLRSSQTA